MRHPIIEILAISLLIACHGTKEKSALPTSSEAIPVKTVALQNQRVQGGVVTSGILLTEDESKLAFKTGGVVASVLVDEGEFVKKGQVLATLKSVEINAQVDQVQLNVEKAQRDLQRVSNLYKDSVATLEQLQNAQTGLAIAQKGLSGVAFNQNYIQIVAPADGFVAKKMLSAGEIAGPGMPVLLLNHVSANSHWVLKAGVSDAEWAAISVGNTSTITFDAFPAKTFTGIVSKKPLVADLSNGAFTVEIRVQLQGEQPAAGMFGKALIATTLPTNTTTIPYDALLEANGKEGFVFITTDGKKAKKTLVSLGNMYQQQIEVTSGLQAGDQLIVSGSAYLTDGSAIIIK